MPVAAAAFPAEDLDPAATARVFVCLGLFRVCLGLFRVSFYMFSVCLGLFRACFDFF